MKTKIKNQNQKQNQKQKLLYSTARLKLRRCVEIVNLVCNSKLCDPIDLQIELMENSSTTREGQLNAIKFKSINKVKPWY